MEADPPGAAPTARGALELVGLVIAPTALVTSLAYYFGWVLTDANASYFGIDASALGLSTQDYVLRSANALFVPLGSLLVIALAVVWLHAIALRGLADRDGRMRVRAAARVAIVVGAVLFVVGAVGALTAMHVVGSYLFRPASPGVGVGLLAWGLHLRARAGGAGAGHAPPAAIGLVGMIIVLSTFWTFSAYAHQAGLARAHTLAASLGKRPLVTVYAPDRLHIRAAAERRLAGRFEAYHYRYTNLRLLLRSGGKYFLVPDGWTHAAGSAIVLDDSPRYRFEFAAGTDDAAANLGGTDTAATRQVAPPGAAGNNAVLPGPVLAGPPVIFGTVRIGDSRHRRYVVRGDSQAHLLTGISLGGAHPEAFVVNRGDCKIGAPLGAGASCTLDLVFRPRKPHFVTAALLIAFDAQRPRSQALTGTGGG